jgi:hypothetical protein
MKQSIVCVFLALIMVACKDMGTPPKPSPGPPAPPPVSGPPQWAMFHHDSRHTGNVHTPLYDAAGPARDTIEVRWRTALDYPVESSPAVGSDGTIFVGTRQQGGEGGSFYAINPDGSVKWHYASIGWVLSSPALGDDGSIYVGGGDGFYALTSSGQLKWRIPEPSPVVSSASIGDDGTVYYVSGYVGQDYLKAVDPATGALKWQTKGGDSQNSPSIGAGGTIYYSSGGTLTAVTPQGQVKWRYKDSAYTTLPIRAQVIGHDGTICFGSGQSPFLYMVDTLGQLRAKIPLHLLSTPCIDEQGNLYVAELSSPSRLVYMASNGRVEWERLVGANSGVLTADLTIEKNGTVYVAVTDDNNHVSMVAFRGQTVLWQFVGTPPDYGGAVNAAPVVFNGNVYFAWAYGSPYLYALQ